jgi:metal-sulfur cluster biosynthetic enzyme
MFIQTESTPDPATLKFLPGRQVSATGNTTAHTKAYRGNSLLADRLLAIPGVSAVVCGGDFLIITKESGDWQLLKPVIFGAIMEYFLVAPPAEINPGNMQKADTYLIDIVRSALRQVMDPELGYNILDLGFIYDVSVAEDGTVHITMTTTTAGCPATDYLRQGASESVRNLPGIKSVEVELTYQPPWAPEMMSPAAKMHFGIRDESDG